MKGGIIISIYIEAERLILKPYCNDDIDNILKLKSEPLIWKFSTQSSTNSFDEAEQQLKNTIENYNQNIDTFHAMFLKSTSEYIGEAGILSFKQSNNRAVVGYNLLPQYWGKGYATEITKALVKYLFIERDVERIEGLVLEENIASRKVLEKSGFFKEGILRNFTFINNIYKNVCYYGIIKEDYI